MKADIDNGRRGANGSIIAYLMVLGVGTGRHMAEVGSWLHSYWSTHTLHGHHDTTHPGSRIDGYITTRQFVKTLDQTQF